RASYSIKVRTRIYSGQRLRNVHAVALAGSSVVSGLADLPELYRLVPPQTMQRLRSAPVRAARTCFENGSVPSHSAERSWSDGGQSGMGDRPEGNRKRELGFLPGLARNGSQKVEGKQHQAAAVAGAAV